MLFTMMLEQLALKVVSSFPFSLRGVRSAWRLPGLLLQEGSGRDVTVVIAEPFVVRMWLSYLNYFDTICTTEMHYLHD